VLYAILRFFLENRLVAFLLLAAAVGWGLSVAPFDFDVPGLPRNPVAVDAIPDIGENQQIVFTRWPGRSPQDVEDQITYPLTSALLGLPGVRSVRSNSMFGFSSIYLIFEEDIEFYWSRSRILEKLNSLPGGVLPEGVSPTLGPDATALGQVYWYTLEGRDPETNEALGGWDLDELRSVQDFYVRYGLSAAEGVAEVASVGGYVREYQVDVDPEAMRIYGVSLPDVMKAIQGSNLDVGASTLEINLAEYFVRGIGYIKSIEDLESAVIKAPNNVPITLGQVAKVNLGPAERRGILDKSGAEAVGGVVVARFGANPLAVIDNVKAKIAALAPGLPSRELENGRTSRVTIVPFYDRSTLIKETIGTLEEALTLEILITAIVVVLMLLNFRSSLIVAGLLPVAVLLCFAAMKTFGVEANIVALSGIAIAIGTMVDMGIVLTENILSRLKDPPEGESLTESIFQASSEVSGAVLTAVATTVVSFLPVFTMEAAEGKLFRPLAYTKTFALVAAILVSLVLLPPLARTLWAWGRPRAAASKTLQRIRFATSIILAVVLVWLLAGAWAPLGVEASQLLNFLFVALLSGLLIGTFWVIILSYSRILNVLLRVKWLFLMIVGLIVWSGVSVYQDIGEEFMPALGEGSFLLMPTSMPHASIQENLANLRAIDMAIQTIPEVETVVGKAGRASSALDPAPLSMYETVINYSSEYKTDADGHRIRYAYNDKEDRFEKNNSGELVPDKNGRYFRQWRDHIQSPDDIWTEIVNAAKLPGVTSAPKLQPIETRLVMLQTGMRAPMGIKVYGSDLATIEAFGLKVESLLKNVDGVKESAVFADRIVGKPYLLLDIDRQAIARFGLSITDVQQVIQTAVGGMAMTTTVEGRERYQVRLRYPRELRNDPAALEQILVDTKTGNGAPVPLGQLMSIRYEQGPQSIKSEDGFLVGYVLFDRLAGTAEVEVVNAAQTYLKQQIAAGELVVPAGINYRFAGNYEQQVRASERLALVVPIALGLIFLILYLQFRSVAVTLMVFSGVAVAFSGGFLMLGAYSTDWFLNFDFFGSNMRDLFQVQTINLSVAVWVGFLALFGIATDDGVLVATFLRDSFRQNTPETIKEIRAAVTEGGERRVRPAMMTTATTILALLPVLTSTGRGADIMVPMAIPSFGGMTLQVLTMFTVPILWASWAELKHHWRNGQLKAKLMPGKKTTILFIGFTLSTALTAQSLPTLIDSMLLQNPSLKALEYEFQAVDQARNSAGQLPDLELGAGFGVLPVETRLGPQRLRIGATQMLPWPGVLDARIALANAKAAPIQEQAAAEALELSYDLSEAYLKLSFLSSSVEVLRESKEVYEVLEATALSRIEAGQGSSVDVYRIALQRELLNKRISLTEAMAGEPLAKANSLLNRPTSVPIVPAQLMQMLADTLAIPSRQLLALEGRRLLSNDHPLLRVVELREAIAINNEKLIALDGKPDFGVGLDYVMTNDRDDAFPTGNGRDAVISRVGISIPLSQKPYTARRQAERLRVRQLGSQKEAVRNRLLAEAEMAFVQLDQARIAFASADRQEEIIEATLRIATTEYAEGRRAFDELIRLQEQLINLQMERVEAAHDILLARAQLTKILAL
jgi:Cu(I)/Ag(I) efflux system membrane protein CusA/SilA